jgi:prepilin-type N-terminal cleavage/methylation domain-containing protein
MNAGIMSRSRQTHEAGFTLLELLCAMAISGIMLGAMLTFFLVQRQYLGAQEQVTEMLQNARAAMDMIVDDIRLTGYGAPRSQFANWITWVAPALNSNPQITPGVGAAPDAISIVGSIDAPDIPLATITADAPAGTAALLLAAGQGSEFNTTTKQLIFIGNENAVVTGVVGDILTIDTNPNAAGNQGLTGSYPANTPIALVKVITYKIDNNTLTRDENTGGGSQPVSGNIENLQITQNGKSLTISLTARTAKQDSGSKNPTTGDHYRRRTLSSEIPLRNF